MSRLKQVFFAGAGGTGKTSVTTAVDKLNAMGIPTYFMGSVSRSFFQSRGITTEQAGLEREEEDRLTFQVDLFHHYLESLEQQREKAVQDGYEVFVCDRSPYDHLSFCIYNAPNLMSRELLDHLWSQANAVVFPSPETDLLTPLQTYIVHFQDGLSWMQDAVVSDGMRWAPPAKNFIVDAILRKLMWRAACELDDADRFMTLGESTVEQRIRAVVGMVLYDELCSANSDL